MIAKRSLSNQTLLTVLHVVHRRDILCNTYTSCRSSMRRKRSIGSQSCCTEETYLHAHSHSPFHSLSNFSCSINLAFPQPNSTLCSSHSITKVLRYYYHSLAATLAPVQATLLKIVQRSTLLTSLHCSLPNAPTVASIAHCR